MTLKAPGWEWSATAIGARVTRERAKAAATLRPTMAWHPPPGENPEQVGDSGDGPDRNSAGGRLQVGGFGPGRVGRPQVGEPLALAGAGALDELLGALRQPVGVDCMLGDAVPAQRQQLRVAARL